MSDGVGLEAAVDPCLPFYCPKSDAQQQRQVNLKLLSPKSRSLCEFMCVCMFLLFYSLRWTTITSRNLCHLKL